MKNFFLYASVVCLLPGVARAADIVFRPYNDTMSVIQISGEIVAGDSDRFKQAVGNVATSQTVVSLDSPGGALFEGLEIGATIKQLGFSTVVPQHTVCASVCGFIWLAGKHRFATTTSQIGFHAAYMSGEGAAPPQESGMGNAVVGAYLAKLGLSYDAIVFVTSSAPQDMAWLTTEQAAKVGIDFQILAADDTGSASPPLTITGVPDSPTASPPPPAASPATLRSFQDGRADRAKWEQWIAGLGGDFKTGALYWAAQRSKKAPGPCNQYNDLFTAGCREAQKILTPIDVRRKAEPSYRAGFNVAPGQ